MDRILDITLYTKAYNELKNLLKANKEDYSCIRLSYINGCPKSSKIEIYLDDLQDKNDYIKQKIKDVIFIYDKEVLDNIKSIELKYENSSFKIKTVPFSNASKTCTASNSCCTSKGSCNSCCGCNRN